MNLFDTSVFCFLFDMILILICYVYIIYYTSYLVCNYFVTDDLVLDLVARHNAEVVIQMILRVEVLDVCAVIT